MVPQTGSTQIKGFFLVLGIIPKMKTAEDAGDQHRFFPVSLETVQALQFAMEHREKVERRLEFLKFPKFTKE